MKPKSDCGVKAEHEGQRGNTGKSVLPRKIRVGETQRQEVVQGERKEAAERGTKTGSEREKDAETEEAASRSALQTHADPG